MIRRFTRLFLVLLSLGLGANAQTWVKDSAVLGPSNGSDVYYNMTSGKVSTVSNQNWLLALSTKFSTAGLFVNHSNKTVLYNTHKDSSIWSSVSFMDTLVTNKQFNPDSSWTEGAGNINKNVSNPFDYGWGKYNMVTHEVYGDSVYIIGNSGMYYMFCIAKMSGGNDYTLKVSPLATPSTAYYLTFNKVPDFDSSNLIYIGVTGTGLGAVQREPLNPLWDVVFTQYNTNVVGQGNRNVSGVLTNEGVQAVRVTPKDINLVTAADTVFNNKRINNIGWDWKNLISFVPVIYQMVDSGLNSYIIKSKNGGLHQIAFTGYTGSSTGIMYFNKRTLSYPASINNVNSTVKSLSITPNPTSSDALVVLEAKSNEAILVNITSANGAILFSKSIALTNGLNNFTIPLTNFSAGTYFLNVRGANTNFSKIISKQ